VDGKLRNLLVRNQVALFAGVSLDSDRVRFDRDGFGSGTEGQLKVDTKAIADCEFDIFLLNGLETTGASLHVIATNGEVRSHVATGVIGRESLHSTRIHAGDSYRYISYDTAGRVGNSADHRGVLSERARWQRDEHEKQRQQVL